MTPLRQKMIDAMQVRGFSARTHQSYLSARECPGAALPPYTRATQCRRASGVLSVSGQGTQFIRGQLPVVFERDPLSLSPGIEAADIRCSVSDAEEGTADTGAANPGGSGPDSVRCPQPQAPYDADDLLRLRATRQ